MDREESFVAVKSSDDPLAPHVGSDDEESFVVLESQYFTNASSSSSSGEEVLPPLRTNKVHEMQNLIKSQLSQLNADLPEVPAAVDALDAVASSVTKITISPDSSYEEIQKQVEELIKENETLKNIITQNNMSMKTQYDRFLGYKDEITKVMKSYRDKFNEAKVCIDKLKEENGKLASDVEVYINIKKLHEEEIINLKDKLRDHEIVHCLEKSDESCSNENIKELQTALAESNVKNKELIDEIDKLKQEACYMVKLQDEHDRLTTKLVALPKLEEELCAKQQELDRLNTKLASLPEIEEHLQQELEKEKSECLNLQSKLAQQENQVKILTEEIKVLRKVVDVLETKETFEKLDQLSKATSDYERKLKLKDAEIISLKQDVQTVKFRESNLEKQVRLLEVKAASSQEKHKLRLEEDYTQVRSQLSFAQETITALEQERESRVGEIENLRELLQESNAKNDEMFALREQITLYKSDFEAEKESKVTMKREKDQLAEDLQNLQKRNKQLQNEIETLRARDQPRAEGYTCPKCNFEFHTYQALENHVHRCLDLDGFP